MRRGEGHMASANAIHTTLTHIPSGRRDAPMPLPLPLLLPNPRGGTPRPQHRARGIPGGGVFLKT